MNVLGFYFTRYGTTDRLPLFASNHPDLVSAVLSTLIEHLERLRREASDPEGAERFLNLLEALAQEGNEDAED